MFLGVIDAPTWQHQRGPPGRSSSYMTTRNADLGKRPQDRLAGLLSCIRHSLDLDIQYASQMACSGCIDRPRGDGLVRG